MAKRPVLLLTGTICTDPAREAEFNQWYDQVHLKEVVKFPGFLSAQRYKTINPQQGYPQYLAVFELEDETVWNNFTEYYKKVRAGQTKGFTPGPPYTTVWVAAFNPI